MLSEEMAIRDTQVMWYLLGSLFIYWQEEWSTRSTAKKSFLQALQRFSGIFVFL